MKTCVTCEQPFTPSSRHKSCPACRCRAKTRATCACGRKMKHSSVICGRCNSSGANNGNWKGGRFLKKGYVMQRAPGHPRALKHVKYVFEHILVMEKRLGRHLLPGENVHHKNGVRHDNRPENLELWLKPQPTGVRVEDAVAWAREILARYSSIVEPGGTAPPSSSTLS